MVRTGLSISLVGMEEMAISPDDILTSKGHSFIQVNAQIIVHFPVGLFQSYSTYLVDKGRFPICSSYHCSFRLQIISKRENHYDPFFSL